MAPSKVMLISFIYLAIFHWVKLLSLLKIHSMKEKWLKANGSEDLKCQQFSNFYDCIYPVFLVIWIHLLLWPPARRCKHKTKMKPRDIKKYCEAWLNPFDFRFDYWWWGRRRWLPQFYGLTGIPYLPPQFCTKENNNACFELFGDFQPPR